MQSSREAEVADDQRTDQEWIEYLMAQPPAGRPSIIVVGDEAVFAINPPKPEPSSPERA